MMLSLHVTSGVAAGTELLLKPPGGLLGRAPACALVLGHPSVSSQHAELRFKEGRWLLYQHTRCTRTTLDGLQVGQVPLALKPSGAIALGEIEIVYQQQALACANEATKAPRMPAVAPSISHLLEPLLSLPRIALPRLVGIHDLPTLIAPPRQHRLNDRAAGPPSLSDLPTLLAPPDRAVPLPLRNRTELPETLINPPRAQLKAPLQPSSAAVPLTAANLRRRCPPGLLPLPLSAGSNTGNAVPPPTAALQPELLLALLSPLSAALEQIDEALAIGRSDQARGQLRSASFALADLYDLVGGRT